MRKPNGRILVPALLIFGFCLLASCANRGYVMTLKCLKPGCSLTKRWMGLHPDSWRVWLKCGSTSFLVIHPLNLLGHVKINTPADALEYVRFFSNVDTYDLFDLDGMVEVLPVRDKDKEELNFNELDEPDFLEHFSPPTAWEVSPRKKAHRGRQEGYCQGRSFYIERVVLMPDQTVQKIVEFVCDDGYYSIISRTVVVQDAWSIGLQYFWIAAS